jgi:hypothetical protein
VSSRCGEDAGGLLKSASEDLTDVEKRDIRKLIAAIEAED